MPETRLSIDIYVEFGRKVGAQQIALLEAIHAEGSITRAARIVGLSYRGTQLLIEATNKVLKEPAVKSSSGGRNGGGAALTPSGIQFVELYRAIEASAQAAALPEREALHRLTRSKMRSR
jgi:molybdate transport system regulatory protein